MVEEAQKIVTTIRQMETAIDDTQRRRSDDEELQITYPLTRCLQYLKEKLGQISRLHKERFEQVKSKLHLALHHRGKHRLLTVPHRAGTGPRILFVALGAIIPSYYPPTYRIKPVHPPEL